MQSETFATAKSATPDPNSGVSDKLFDAASQVKSKASDLGRLAADKIDGNRDGAADGLESAGTSLHAKADSLPGGPKVTRAAHAAADSLNSTAQYIREHDVASMMADVKRLVKNNPGPALLGAAILGFVLARTLSRD
jgi:hypothetical protein